MKMASRRLAESTMCTSGSDVAGIKLPPESIGLSDLIITIGQDVELDYESQAPGNFGRNSVRNSDGWLRARYRFTGRAILRAIVARLAGQRFSGGRKFRLPGCADHRAHFGRLADPRAHGR